MTESTEINPLNPPDEHDLRKNRNIVDDIPDSMPLQNVQPETALPHHFMGGVLHPLQALRRAIHHRKEKLPDEHMIALQTAQEVAAADADSDGLPNLSGQFHSVYRGSFISESTPEIGEMYDGKKYFLKTSYSPHRYSYSEQKRYEHYLFSSDARYTYDNEHKGAAATSRLAALLHAPHIETEAVFIDGAIWEKSPYIENAISCESNIRELGGMASAYTEQTKADLAQITICNFIKGTTREEVGDAIETTDHRILPTDRQILPGVGPPYQNIDELYGTLPPQQWPRC